MFDDEEGDNFSGSYDRTRKLPIYIKAEEILKLVDHITEAVENTDITYENEAQEDWLDNSIHFMRENALLIPAKIASAESNGLYDICMENAALIRKAARELITDARGLDINGYKDEEYLDLLRTAVDEFRLLFAEWVKGFDEWDFIIDRWGLFNPPGINYDDEDLDGDASFNLGDLPEEFLSDYEDEDWDDDEWDDEDEDADADADADDL